MRRHLDCYHVIVGNSHAYMQSVSISNKGVDSVLALGEVTQYKFM